MTLPLLDARRAGGRSGYTLLTFYPRGRNENIHRVAGSRDAGGPSPDAHDRPGQGRARTKYRIRPIRCTIDTRRPACAGEDNPYVPTRAHVYARPDPEPRSAFLQGDRAVAGLDVQERAAAGEAPFGGVLAEAALERKCRAGHEAHVGVAHAHVEPAAGRDVEPLVEDGDVLRPDRPGNEQTKQQKRSEKAHRSEES